MTFAELRRTVLRAGPLSTTWFAESVTYTPRSGTPRTVTVKIEMETKPRRDERRPIGATQRDESQRIRVVISRETNWSGGGLASTPQIGDTITRAVARDADERPWTYTGETVAESELAGTYVFERARRHWDARRTEQA